MITVRSDGQIDQYIKWLKKEGRSFEIHTRNSRRMVITDEKEKLGRSYRKKLSEEAMKRLWIYSIVRKQVTIRVKKMENLYFTPTRYSPQVRNKKQFIEMPVGTRFVAVDANHAYWRMAFLRGYIGEKLYNRLLPQEYKLHRNKSLACLVSTEKVERYEGKELVSSYELGDPLLTAVYLDIRQSLYEIFHEIVKVLNSEGFVKYHTDCIYVLPERENLVKALIMGKDMQCSVAECMKINAEEFMEKKRDGNWEIKRF